LFVWGILALGITLARLCHRNVLWVEEAYPAAAAAQLFHWLTPYLDYVFDKPPGSILVYAMWAAIPGVVQRLAGAAFVLLCSWLAFGFARDVWGRREGRLAAVLMAFHLTFYVPSAVIALAPDLLMVAPHLAAVWLAWRKRWLAAGGTAALAMLFHTKGIIVAAACLMWAPLSMLTSLAGLVLFLMPGYFEQVWDWGLRYSADTFVAHPGTEGAVRTASWLGFHAAAALGTLVYFFKERQGERLKMALWLLVSFLGIAAGSRFFPRYYFLALPCLVLLGARGVCLMPKRWMHAAALALLLIPFLRFGPRYWELAVHGDGDWADTAMNRDSRDAAQRILELARPSDTILVWGYRPDILVYTRLKLGAPFLDSQPLTGVLADRHLSDSAPTYGELAAQNRASLARLRPTWVIDGLGPYNSTLAVGNYSDLADWLSRYEVIFRTRGTIAYRLRKDQASLTGELP
jgi:hypothetical protein